MPKTINRETVYNSLIEQLKLHGANIDVFISQVDDYMKLWDIKEKLAEDIKTRGVVYSDVSSVGVEMQKNNPSTKEIVNISRQMLAILKQLNLSIDNVITAGDIEDDEL